MRFEGHHSLWFAIVQVMHEGSQVDTQDSSRSADLFGCLATALEGAEAVAGTTPRASMVTRILNMPTLGSGLHMLVLHDIVVLVS